MTNQIITIGREFGSGGRELGKRLAEQLGCAYYDREIVLALCEKNGLAQQYVENITSAGIQTYYPISYGRTFSTNRYYNNENTQLIVMQQQIIKELGSKSNCVIVGRNADIILREYKPFNLFIYSDISSCIERCRSRENEDNKKSDKELKKQINQINTNRKKSRALVTEIPWGAKEAYHLCINTSNLTIKDYINPVALLAENYFKENEK